MKLHCENCAYMTNSGREGVGHVMANPTHVVRGEGPDPDTTVTIKIEEPARANR